MNIRTKTVLIIGFYVSILIVGLLTVLSRLLSIQIEEKENFTLTNRLQEFLEKPSGEPLELTNQDQLCRAGGENHLKINILYPDQADFSVQIQKIEANRNRHNGPLIDKVQETPASTCSRSRNRQPNSPPPDLSKQLPSPSRQPPDQRQSPKKRTFYINGEPVQIDTQALQLTPQLSPEPKDRDRSKAVVILMRNTQGEPVAVMQLLSPSPFSKTAENITNSLLIVGMALLFFSMILYFVLDKLVLSRISRLDQQVGKIKGDLQNRGNIKLGGQDELANLAKSINKMLQRQITFQKELHQAKQQMEIANQELERLAKTDGLTQIMNRHFFQLNLEEIWQEALKSQLPVSLILCDVDFFKLYNDTYGHLAGDLCLQKVAKAMQEAAGIEPRAIVARYGGEEFVVILPQIDGERAAQVAEKVRSTIGHLKLPHSASKTAHHVTLSLGVCTLIPQSHLSPRDLIGQADQHLYQAKANGRNQVVAQILTSDAQA